MIRMLVAVSVLACMLPLTACYYLLREPGGDRVYVKTEIQFVDKDGQIIANKPAIVYERVGSSYPATEIMSTDAQGRIYLDGYYCLPMYLHAERTIWGHDSQGEILPNYRAEPMGGGEAPTPKLTFGKILPAHVSYGRRHEDCG